MTRTNMATCDTYKVLNLSNEQKVFKALSDYKYKSVHGVKGSHRDRVVISPDNVTRKPSKVQLQRSEPTKSTVSTFGADISKVDLPTVSANTLHNKKHLSVATYVALFILVIVLIATIASICIATDLYEANSKIVTLLQKQLDIKSELLDEQTNMKSNILQQQLDFKSKHLNMLLDIKSELSNNLADIYSELFKERVEIKFDLRSELFEIFVEIDSKFVESQVEIKSNIFTERLEMYSDQFQSEILINFDKRVDMRTVKKTDKSEKQIVDKMFPPLKRTYVETSQLRIKYGDSCFCLFREQLSWYAARDFCLSKGNGVHLADVYHSEVNNFLMPILQASSNNPGIWLGASNLAQDGVWKWNYTGVQVEQFEPSQWDPRQSGLLSPMGQLEHCLGVLNCNVLACKWGGDSCEQPKLFLCVSFLNNSKCAC